MEEIHDLLWFVRTPFNIVKVDRIIIKILQHFSLDHDMDIYSFLKNQKAASTTFDYVLFVNLIVNISLDAFRMVFQLLSLPKYFRF